GKTWSHPPRVTRFWSERISGLVATLATLLPRVFVSKLLTGIAELGVTGAPKIFKLFRQTYVPAEVGVGPLRLAGTHVPAISRREMSRVLAIHAGGSRRKRASNPACSKWWSCDKARVMRRWSMTTKEMQSVNDHSLSALLAVNCSPAVQSSAEAGITSIFSSARMRAKSAWNLGRSGGKDKPFAVSHKTYSVTINGSMIACAQACAR